MKKYALALCLLLIVNFVAISQEKVTGGLIYGENWMCLLKAPENWIMDQKSFAPYGIYGLFYEDGKQLGKDTPIIYVNTNKLKNNSEESLSAYISADLQSYKNKGFAVKEYFLNGNTDKKLRTYQFTKGDTVEICSYTRYENTCFLIILTAQKESLIADCIDELEFIINNMKFINASVDDMLKN